MKVKRTITVDCKCGASVSIESPTINGAYALIRKRGWAIDANRENFYCPSCAPYHRHVGCKGANACHDVQTRINLD